MMRTNGLQVKTIPFLPLELQNPDKRSIHMISLFVDKFNSVANRFPLSVTHCWTKSFLTISFISVNFHFTVSVSLLFYLKYEFFTLLLHNSKSKSLRSNLTKITFKRLFTLELERHKNLTSFFIIYNYINTV